MMSSNMSAAEDFNSSTELRNVSSTLPFPRLDLSHLAAIIAVSYLVTFVIGLVGNTTVIYLIIVHSKMKTIANYLILSLALSDDLHILTMPFFAYSSLHSNWIFGTVFCKFFLSLWGINKYSSVFTMVVMSLDRYLAIVHPVKSLGYRTINKAKVACGLVWGISACIILPYWIYGTAKEKIDDKATCGLFWPQEYGAFGFEFWTGFQFIIGFALPLITIIYCYTNILKKLNSTIVPLVENGSLQTAGQVPRHVMKVNSIILTVIVVFGLCWTPYNIAEIVSLINYYKLKIDDTRPTEDEIRFFAYFNAVAQILVFISSCCNPFIYGLRSKDFRKLLIGALRNRCRVSIVEVGRDMAHTQRADHFISATEMLRGTQVATPSQLEWGASVAMIPLGRQGPRPTGQVGFFPMDHSSVSRSQDLQSMLQQGSTCVSEAQFSCSSDNTQGVTLDRATEVNELAASPGLERDQ